MKKKTFKQRFNDFLNSEGPSTFFATFFAMIFVLWFLIEFFETFK